MASNEAPVYQRKVSVDQGNPIPDVAGAAREYGAATNWMSAAGSAVASAASNQMAQQLGAEAGKNPTPGGPGMTMTGFDKTFAESYTTQAHSTLGLQANKLISDSNLEVAKAGRVTPQLIAQQNRQVSLGLQKIFEMAPPSIRPQMELQYGSIQLNQNEQVTNRMIGEQHEDQRNQTALSSQINAENAHSLAMAGNYAAAQSFVEATARSNKAGVDVGVINPVTAKVSTDTARQSYLSGKYSREAEIARSQGKEAEFFKGLADKRPSDLSDADYPVVTNAAMAHMQQLDNLRNQSEQLRTARMNVSIAKDVMGITGEQLEDYRQNVSPLQFEQTQLKYIQAVKAFNQQKAGVDSVIANFGNSEALANSTPETINKAFNLLTDQAVQKSKVPLSRDEAEVQIAASAGAPVPVFIKTLENKLSSGNPGYIESAAQQIHALQQMGAGHALAGLSDQAKVMAAMVDSIRTSTDPTTAAREATNIVYNQTPEMQKANAEKWSNHYRTQTKDITPTDFAMKISGLNASSFINNTTANMYAADILETYKGFYQLSNGDAGNAEKITKRFVEQNYGETGVNGSLNTTLHPLEKVLGYKSHDVVPYIQQDVVNQLNNKFIPIKEAYAKGETNEYWETVPITREDKGWFSSNFDPIKVKRHMKEGASEKVDTFEVVLQGNAFDNWDVAINSDSGMRSLFQIAPYLGVTSYVPNQKAIDTAYLNDHKSKA